MPSPSERYRLYVADTMAVRIPRLLAATIDAAGPADRPALEALALAIAEDRPMAMDYAAWPTPGWEDLPACVEGRRPSEAPFFDFEFWMYYRILAAVRFAETGTDPFRATKHRDLDRHLAMADAALGRVKTLADALRFSLDGNAHDLSQIARPAGAHEVGTAALGRPGPGLRRLNIIADNFGAEFVADLVLALVAAEAGTEAVLHVKQLPMFISDVTTGDVTALLGRLGEATGLARRVRRALGRGTLRFATHPFWSAPRFLDQMPTGVLGMGAGVLSVLKGDLNFRRALGDASVAIDTPLAGLRVLPAAPLLSLRSIKSYCVAGMQTWPADIPRDDFPMDGSIAVVQEIPARAP